MSRSQRQNGRKDMEMAKNRPVKEINLGAIKAVVWLNETQSGPRHNVQFQRLYLDGDEWKQSESFGRDDLLPLAKLADMAHTWIHAEVKKNRETAHG